MSQEFTKEQIDSIEGTKRKLISFFNKLTIFSLMLFFVCPFVWIWDSWYYGWRIGLSAIILIIASMCTSWFITKAFEKIKISEVKPMSKVKESGFRKRLNEAMEKAQKNQEKI